MFLCHLKVSAYMDSSCTAHKVGVETLFPASTTITGTNAPNEDYNPYDPNTIAKLLLRPHDMSSVPVEVCGRLGLCP